jgi:NADPH:quinone reductase
MSDATATALELRSLIRKDGELELSLVKVPVPEPGPDEVLVKVEASPINPSDLGLLVGPADMSQAQSTGSGEDIVVRASVPSAALPFLAARLDQSMPVGNEGRRPRRPSTARPCRWSAARCMRSIASRK